ncbi:XRE family transcriptional regulator [Brevundimonas sp. NIBR11]|uniref:ImmA/IrrE family metallo-endopeptidase n=1 Tax=Brevundimonas sp. NIBR11 TaxID=3015999 RepID=UPI0022F139A1|nr:XRE family transcriptional regulator [Brevundimonas sp. NIBR11]
MADDLVAALASYENAKAGDYSSLVEEWRGEPGMTLVIARIARGMSQAALAERLGLREQQVQRYEADRYRSISLSNYRKIAGALGVEIRAAIRTDAAASFRMSVGDLPDYDAASLRRVVKHALAQGWIRAPASDESAEALLLDYVRDSVGRLGSPTLLRTGLKPLSLDDDLALSVWRARVIEKFDALEISGQFDPMDISWLPSLVALSRLDDGITRVPRMLSDHGIAFVYEAHFTGLRVDGAALQIDGKPIVALSLRHDRIDNFWFTLMHELAHVYLHQRMGIETGFYDDLDEPGEDQVEDEADQFASSTLIPDEVWIRSPARISKDHIAIERFAENLRISPAIVFGRVRKERNNYKIFHDRVGLGCVRKQLVQD